MMRYLSETEVLLVHFKLIERFGGSHGVRDAGRLKFAMIAPKQIVFDQEQNPGLFNKAAVYARNIIGDHPFTDGNMRTGISVAILFLRRNGQNFAAQTGEIEDFAVRVAVEHLDVPAIAAWLESHAG